MVCADILAVRTAPVKVDAVVAHMREHAVEHHTDAHLTRFLAQAAEGLLIAKHGIDPHVIARVVLVIGARFKDRVKVQHADTQILQIRQLLANALQIAAKEVVGKVIPVFGDVERGHFIPVLMQEDILPCLGVQKRVRALAVEEAVHHDLVHHAVVHPLGRFICRIIDGDLEAVRAAHDAYATACVIIWRAEDLLSSVGIGLEPVPVQIGRVAHRQMRLVEGFPVPRTQKLHGVAVLAAIPHPKIHAIQHKTSAQRHAQAQPCACRHRARGRTIKHIQCVMTQVHLEHSIRIRGIKTHDTACFLQGQSLFYRTFFTLSNPFSNKERTRVHIFVSFTLLPCYICFL